MAAFEGSRRFYVASLWVATMMVLAAVAVACEGEEPTPTPTPTSMPVPTKFPMPSTPDSPFEFWDWDMSHTGSDLVALLTDEEVSCLRNELGASYQIMLEAPLIDVVDELAEAGGIGPSPGPPCLTPEHYISASLSMLSVASGGLSAGSRDCILQLLSDYPALPEAIGSGNAFEGPEMLRFIACLTPEEAAALTTFLNGEDPPPNPNEISCLIQELEDTSSGEHIIAVISGEDTSGVGLTTAESAVLGQAVEACGIETDFVFPSQ